jgi:hypothetical protein
MNRLVWWVRSVPSVGGRDEQRARASLYPTFRRAVTAVPLKAPATVTRPGARPTGSSCEHAKDA